MSESRKHKKSGLHDFLRYRKGGMSGKEKNSFERELQKDPFAEEAMEGMLSVTPEEFSADVNRLKAAVKARSRSRKSYIYYRIAASVAVLMIISSVFYVVNRNNTGTSLSTDAGIQTITEIKKPEPVIKGNEDEDVISAKEKKIAPALSGATDKAEVQVTKDLIKADEQEKVAESAAENHADEIKAVAEPSPVAENRNDVQLVTDYNREAKARSLMKPAPSVRAGVVKGSVISADDSTPLPGVTINIKGTSKGVVTDNEGNFSLDVNRKDATLVASYIGMETKELNLGSDTSVVIGMSPSEMSLSEVVVTGYGRQKKEVEQEDYVPPKPVNGMNEFNRYIEKNIHRPDSLSGQRVVVVAGMRVRADGSIDSIKIIRSPGPGFSEEALRLIKSGPGWLPAEQNGEKIDDNVRVRIVFR